MSEQIEETAQYSQNSPFCLEFNCCGTQLLWPGRQYLTNQRDDIDVLGVTLYCADSSQANSCKQQSTHMEIVHHLICWERNAV